MELGVDKHGTPFWTAPSGTEYALPEDYVGEADIIAILRRLKKDGLLTTRRMIMRELDLLD